MGWGLVAGGQGEKGPWIAAAADTFGGLRHDPAPKRREHRSCQQEVRAFEGQHDDGLLLACDAAGRRSLGQPVSLRIACMVRCDDPR